VSERIRRCPFCDRPIFNNALVDHVPGCGWPDTFAAHVQVLNDAFSDQTAEMARPLVWLAGHYPRLFTVIWLACLATLAAILAGVIFGLIPTHCPDGSHAVGLLCLGRN
jgi:hypothetical protein